VDFQAKQIQVRRQLDPDLTVRNQTKTKASTAPVPLLPALERELKAHRARQAEVGLHLVKADQLILHHLERQASVSPQCPQGRPHCRRCGRAQR
jgi:type II secretory pathway component HofQ